MGALYLMVGIPASGKTTVARRLEKMLGAIWISSDWIRERIYPEAEAAISHRGSPACEWVHEWARQWAIRELRAGRDVILDATHANPRARREVVLTCGRYAKRVVAIQMVTPLEECLKRHRSRAEKGVRADLPEEYILRTAEQLAQDPPDADEGIDRIYFIGECREGGEEVLF